MDQSRYADNYAHRKSSGEGKSVFDFSVLPKGTEVNWYKPVEGPGNKIDIIEYKIAGKKHPYVYAGKYRAGETDYKLDILMHRNVGATQASVVCNRQYNKPCPACELAEQLRRSGDKDGYLAAKAKRVCFYNVVDLNHPEKGIQIFQTPQSTFDFELIEEAKNSTDDGSYVDFANNSAGHSVSFRAVTSNGGGYSYFEYRGIRFTKRTYSVAEEAAKAFPLDELLVVKSYEDIAKMISGETDEDLPIDEGAPIREEIPPAKEEASATPLKTSIASAVIENATNRCPSGHVFGADNDKFQKDCDACPVWKDCYKASV